MTPAERNYGALMVYWGRTIEQHREPDFYRWLERFLVQRAKDKRERLAA